ncbi:hypothetical protein [Streptomyces xanthochromogenes]
MVPFAPTALTASSSSGSTLLPFSTYQALICGSWNTVPPGSFAAPAAA